MKRFSRVDVRRLWLDAGSSPAFRYNAITG